MKNILALIGLAVVLFAGLGWYLGWYKLGVEPAADGHRKINVDVDVNKIKSDAKKGEQKIEQVITPGSNGATSAPTEKKVEATPTGMRINPDGTVDLITFPKLDPPK